MLIVFDGTSIGVGSDLPDVWIMGYASKNITSSGLVGSGILCASGWIGSGLLGHWNVSGYDGYVLHIQDTRLSMSSPIITVPSLIKWTLDLDQLPSS
jgi:hypothetical protein